MTTQITPQLLSPGAPKWDAQGNVTISGNLNVTGATNVIDTTTHVIEDPLITLGGTVEPTANDGKFRGIEFRYHDGNQAHLGFFGFDPYAGTFIFVPQATNTSEIITGTKGIIQADLLGIASRATALETPRSFSITGKGTADAISFNGLYDVALNLTSLSVNASDINAGIIASARLGSGVGSTGTFLRGDSAHTNILANDFLLSASSQSRYLKIGQARTGSALSALDLIGDTTYTDFGLRLVRGASGPDSSSELRNRGIGTLRIVTQEAGAVALATNNVDRLTIAGDGSQALFSTPIVQMDGGYINGAAGTTRTIGFRSSTINRWNIGLDSVLESSGNVGSNFTIQRFATNGSLIDTPFSINRATGAIALLGQTTVTGAFSTDTGGSTSTSVPSLALRAGAARLQVNPWVDVGTYNPLVQSGDTLISYNANAGQNTGALVIGQWSTFARGLRIAATGVTTFSHAPAWPTPVPEENSTSGATTAFVKTLLESYAPLDPGGKISATYLPSYVDDVLEFANSGAFPTTGETGKLYIAINTNLSYRWSGSTYVEIVGSPGSTDAVPEGSTNKYFTDARARAAITGGASTVTSSNLTASRALVSDASGKIAVAAATAAELSYLEGVTSSIQTQLNSKVNSVNPQFSGNVGIGGVGSANLDVFLPQGRIMFRSGRSLNSIDSVTTSNSTYTALNIETTALTRNGNTIWDASNFDPNSKVNTSSVSTSATGGTVAQRDSSGDITARLLRTTFANETSAISGALAYRIDPTSNNYTRYCSNPASIRNWLGLGTGDDVGFSTVSASRLIAGYDPATANSVGAANWFRSTGNTGWHNDTYSVGIYATDSTYLRSYLNKPMVASDFVLSSDARRKTAVTPFKYAGPLNPVSYTFRVSGKSDSGFIAQDVQKLYPWAVSCAEDGFLHLSYQKLTVVLSAQLNKLEEDFSEIKQQFSKTSVENNQLKQEIDLLRTRFDNAHSSIN